MLAVFWNDSKEWFKIRITKRGVWNLTKLNRSNKINYWIKR